MPVLGTTLYKNATLSRGLLVARQRAGDKRAHYSSSRFFPWSKPFPQGQMNATGTSPPPIWNATTTPPLRTRGCSKQHRLLHLRTRHRGNSFVPDHFLATSPTTRLKTPSPFRRNNVGPNHTYIGQIQTRSTSGSVPDYLHETVDPQITNSPWLAQHEKPPPRIRRETSQVLPHDCAFCLCARRNVDRIRTKFVKAFGFKYPTWRHRRKEPRSFH